MTRSQMFTANRLELDYPMSLGVCSQLGHNTATRRGSHDFASVNQIVATKYEVLVEHTQAARAHQPLAPMPREATVL